jgi:hypothetical protein
MRPPALTVLALVSALALGPIACSSSPSAGGGGGSGSSGANAGSSGGSTGSSGGSTGSSGSGGTSEAGAGSASSSSGAGTLSDSGGGDDAGGVDTGSTGRVGDDAGGSADAATSGGAPDGSVSQFTCNLIFGVEVTGEWINGGGLFSLLDGTKWESITRWHEYTETFVTDNTIYMQKFDPATMPMDWTKPSGMPEHMCAQNAMAPDRVFGFAYADTTVAMYSNWANPADPTVRTTWVSMLEALVKQIQMHYPSVKRIELLTMVRGPGTTGPGMNCGADSMEGVVGPWVDDAIATVSQNHPGLVVPALKMYVGACNWFRGSKGPYFVMGGMPAKVAQLFADYYKTH